MELLERELRGALRAGLVALLVAGVAEPRVPFVLLHGELAPCPATLGKKSPATLSH